MLTDRKQGNYAQGGPLYSHTRSWVRYDSQAIASIVVVFFVHANDLVVGREQRHGHAEHEGEEAPVEALLNEEQLEGEHHEEQTTDV